MKKHNLTIILSSLVSLFFLWLALRKVNVYNVYETLKSAKLGFLALALICTILAYLMKGLRWKILLFPVKKCRLIDTTSHLVIGFMANCLLPLRVGEFIRAYVNGKKENISKTASFATIVVERVFDGLSMLLILFILFLSGLKSAFSPWVRRTTYLVLLLFLGVFLLLYIIVYSKETGLKIISKILFLLPKKIKDKLVNLIGHFTSGLDVLKKKKEVATIVMLSLLIWLTEGTVFYFCSLSLNLNISFPVAIFVMLITAFSLIIPSSPGFVGVYEYFCMLSLMIFGVPKDAALGFAIFVHFFVFLIIVLAGFIFLWKENLSLGQMKKEITSENFQGISSQNDRGKK